MTTTPKPLDWLKSQKHTASAAVVQAPSCDAEDAVDSQVERFLQLHGVKYAPKTMIPIGLIDEKQSLGNQARDVPIVPESVERFTAALKKGAYLPPIVVFPSGNRVVIVDGNNRYASHKKANSAHVPGYVIDEHTPSETIHLLTVAANNDHGVTPDLKWRKRQASHLLSLGFTADKACEAAGVTKTQLTDFQALQRADAKAIAQRVSKEGWNALNDTTRTAIGRMSNDAVFVAAANCAITTGLDSESARMLLRDVKAASSEADQLAHVARVRQERELEARTRAATGASNRVSSKKHSLLIALAVIDNLPADILAAEVLTEHERMLIIRRIDATGVKLIELQVALSDALEALRAV